MRLEPQKKGKIKIILTPQDMASFGVSYEQMDYGDPRTRRILTHLLETARLRAGFLCPDGAKLLIEAFPTLEGGCTILFTVLGCGTDHLSRPESIFAFAFPTLEALGKAAAHLEAQRTLPGADECRCSLYRLPGEYRILCRLQHPLSTGTGQRKEQPPCHRELLRRGRYAGTGHLAAAYCGEHGQLLASQNALKKLARCWEE